MKSYERVLGFAVVALFAFCIGAGAEGVGVVVALKSPVTIEREGAEFAANLGDEVHLHDIIKTGIGGRAKILFDGKVILVVIENTTVEIEKHLYDSRANTTNSSFELRNGVVRSILDKFHDTSLDISSRNAIAGVRGTDFIMKYAPDQDATQVYVFRGAVEVKNRLEAVPGAVTLPANHWTEVSGRKGPEQPMMISREAIDRLNNETSIADQVRKDALKHFQKSAVRKGAEMKGGRASAADVTRARAGEPQNVQVQVVGQDLILPSGIASSAAERAAAISGGVTTSGGRLPAPGGSSSRPGEGGRPGGPGGIVGRPDSGGSGGGLPDLLGR